MHVWVPTTALDGDRVWRLEEVGVEAGSVLSSLYFKVMPHEAYYFTPDDYVRHREDLGLSVSLAPEIVAAWRARVLRLKPSSPVPGEEECP